MSKQEKLKILVAAGGTGGHIYPGIAISDKLKETFPGAQIVFVGSYVGLEKNIVPKYGYNLEYLRSRGFDNGFSIETLKAVKGLFESYRDAGKLLKKYKPDLVIGTGGFTSAMLLIKAAQMKIPTMIHEQNAYPGKSNRLAGRFVDKIALSFLEASNYFKEDKVFLAGNPIREEFKKIDRKEARKRFGLKEDDILIIFMGGSQGAETINKAATYFMKNHTDKNLVFYHLAGKDQVEAVKEELKDLDNKNIHVYGYFEDMAGLLSAGDIVVSRSGAMSVAEISACELPSILIPFPLAAGDHQTYNARVLSDKGAGILIPDGKASPEKVEETILDLIDSPEKLEEMRLKAGKFKILDADARFCREAKELVESSKEK